MKASGSVARRAKKIRRSQIMSKARIPTAKSGYKVTPPALNHSRKRAQADLSSPRTKPDPVLLNCSTSKGSTARLCPCAAADTASRRRWL
jgi:hypothetical protein